MVAVSFRVEGRVQGVSFRDTVRRAAADDAVTGWVANRDDGAVEGVLEGASAAVARVLDVCRAGPPDASVQRFDCRSVEPEGAGSFEIR